MAYDIFKKYGLDKIKDSLTEDYDYKDTDTSKWELIRRKAVEDSDGFMTDYSWYTDGTQHIFMFGDADIYTPDIDYADHVADSAEEAKEWFDSYNGFAEESEWDNFEEDDIDNTPSGNSDFMNDGFNNVYSDGLDLEY